MTEKTELVTTESVRQMQALPWFKEVNELGILIHNCGRYSRPMCPTHGWIEIYKFGKFRWGCTHGLRVISIVSEKFLDEVERTAPHLLKQWAKEKRCWSNCHFKVEYKPSDESLRSGRNP